MQDAAVLLSSYSVLKIEPIIRYSVLKIETNKEIYVTNNIYEFINFRKISKPRN